MQRYHPALVALHWLLALMLIVALVVGSQILAETPNSNPEKVTLLGQHMVVGLLILVLMLIRLTLRWRTAVPPEADTGNSLLNRMGGWAHMGLYLLVFVMAASGIGLSLLAGLGDIVFFGSGAALPADFDDYTPRIVHGIVSKLLFALILLHIAAALYHQFLRKDGLMGRMWFGAWR